MVNTFFVFRVCFTHRDICFSSYKEVLVLREVKLSFGKQFKTLLLLK